MNIIIIGAGEFGRNLAATFCNDRHDVVVVDLNQNTLKRIQSNLDVMTVLGDGASVADLKTAGIKTADLLVAVSNNDNTNVLACQIGKHFAVKTTICRLSSTDCFSEEDGLAPKKFGVDYVVVPQDECVQKVLNVLDSRAVLEKIEFSNPDALMTAVMVLPSSPIAGMRISDFPDQNLLGSVRFSAIVRNRELLIPHGDTIVMSEDELYISGQRGQVEAMVRWINPDDTRISRVIIAGGSKIGKDLALALAKRKYEVTVIESDLKTGEDLLEELSDNVLVINGVPTESEVLEEAGIATCDAFVSALSDDEDNLLSCVLAKRHGAKKVIAITNKSEYVYIVPDMNMIDCGFSTRLVASNSVLRNPISGTLNIDAILHRVDAYVFEFKVANDSPVRGKTIMECKCPPSAVFAMLIRGDAVQAAAGDIELRTGDIVVAIATPGTARALQPLFNKQGLFS